MDFSKLKSTTNTNAIANDSNYPLSFQDWSQQSHYLEQDNLNYFYNQYIINWFKTNSNKNLSQTFVLKQKYLFLLNELQLFFTEEEKNKWYNQINFGDERDILAAIPYFARKLKNIALYYLKLRKKLKYTKLRYNLVGTPSGLETEIYNLILNAFSPSTVEENPEFLSVSNLFPTLQDSLVVKVEELYDDNQYFDRSPTVSLSSYVNLLDEATTKFFETQGIVLSSSEWIFKTFNIPVTTDINSFVNELTSNIFETTDAALYTNFIQKFVNENKYNVSVFDVSDENSYFVSNISLSSGNNIFNYPIGKIDPSLILNKAIKPVALSSINIVGSTSNTNLEGADTIFVKLGNSVKGAWYRYIDYDISSENIVASLQENSVTTFIYPFVNYGLSAENSAWTLPSLQYNSNYNYLKSDLKSAIQQSYWALDWIPQDTCDSVFINRTTLLSSGATPGKILENSDRIYLREQHSPGAYTPYKYSEGAWLYKFDKTALPVSTSLTGVCFWPYAIVDSTSNILPTHLEDIDATNNASATQIRNLNSPYFISSNDFTFADKIYKLKNPSDDISLAIECAWLKGSIESNTHGDQTFYYSQQDGFTLQCAATGQKLTRFVWTGPDNTPIKDVFTEVGHQEDCPFSLTNVSLNKSKDWQKCSCKQVYYSPYGHPGISYNEYTDSADFIIEDTTNLGEFPGINNWVDSDGNTVDKSLNFAWYKTNDSITWGNGKWVTYSQNNNYNTSPLLLQTGKSYFYYRTNANNDNVNFPPYIVLKDFTYSPRKGVWMEARKISIANNTWADNGRVSEMKLYPGDYVKFERQNQTTVYYLSTYYTPVVSENRGSIWATYDYVAITPDPLANTTVISWPENTIWSRKLNNFQLAPVVAQVINPADGVSIDNPDVDLNTTYVSNQYPQFDLQTLITPFNEAATTVNVYTYASSSILTSNTIVPEVTAIPPGYVTTYVTSTSTVYITQPPAIVEFTPTSDIKKFIVPDGVSTITVELLGGGGGGGSGILNRRSVGSSRTLKLGTNYNVDDYNNASASINGTPKSLGTITLTFTTSSGQTQSYTHTATGNYETGGDDTLIDWDRDNIYLRQGYRPGTKKYYKQTDKIIPRPFQGITGVTFRFDYPKKGYKPNSPTGNPYVYSEGTDGGGGGSGGYVTQTFNVTSNDVFTFDVGIGGSGGIANKNGFSDSGKAGTDTVLTYKNAKVYATGGRGGDGTIVPTYYQPSDELYAVTSNFAWGSWMNNHAVWVNPATNTLSDIEQTIKRWFKVSTDGVYTFSYDYDNYVQIYIDDELKSNPKDGGHWSDTPSTFTQTLKTGLHFLTIKIKNASAGASNPAVWAGSNPGGVGLVISDSKKNIFWNLRDYLTQDKIQTNTTEATQSFGGAGGAPNGISGSNGQKTGSTVYNGAAGGSITNYAKYGYGGNGSSTRLENKANGDTGGNGYVKITYVQTIAKDIIISTPVKSRIHPTFTPLPTLTPTPTPLPTLKPTPTPSPTPTWIPRPTPSPTQNPYGKILSWKVVHKDTNQEFNYYNATAFSFTPPYPGIYYIEVLAQDAYGTPIRLYSSSSPNLKRKTENTIIPDLTAVPYLQPNTIQIPTGYPSAGFLLEEELKGWNYDYNRPQQATNEINVGAKPYWAEIYAEKDYLTNYKNIDEFGYPKLFVSDYLPYNIPRISPLTLGYGSIVQYRRRGKTIWWTQPTTYKTKIDKSLWSKLEFDNTFSNLSSIYVTENFNKFKSFALHEPSDILLINNFNGTPSEVSYYSLSTNFVWSLTAEYDSINPILSSSIKLNYSSANPTTVLSNRFFPTIAVVPTLENIYSLKDCGGYFLPNELGASQFLNTNFTPYIAATATQIAIENSTVHVGGYGLTKQEQPSIYDWTEDNTWLKEPPTANALAGYPKKSLTKVLQKFVPYQSNSQTNVVGLITPNSRLTPWGGLNQDIWTDTNNHPQSFTGVDNIPVWNNSQVLKENSKIAEKWTTDIYGNQYGLYKQTQGMMFNERMEAPGEIWTRNNAQIVAPGYVSLSSVYDFVDPTLYSQLASEIITFDCFFDTLMFETPNMLLFSKVKYDYATNVISSNFTNARGFFEVGNLLNIPLANGSTKQYESNWFFPKKKKVTVLVTEKYDGYFIPTLYSLDLNTLKFNLQFPTLSSDIESIVSAVSQINLNTIQNATITYNSKIKQYLLTYTGLDSSANKQPYFVNFIISDWSNHTLEKIDIYTDQTSTNVIQASPLIIDPSSQLVVDVIQGQPFVYTAPKPVLNSPISGYFVEDNGLSLTLSGDYITFTGTYGYDYYGQNNNTFVLYNNVGYTYYSLTTNVQRDPNASVPQKPIIPFVPAPTPKPTLLPYVLNLPDSAIVVNSLPPATTVSPADEVNSLQSNSLLIFNFNPTDLPVTAAGLTIKIEDLNVSYSSLEVSTFSIPYVALQEGFTYSYTITNLDNSTVKYGTYYFVLDSRYATYVNNGANIMLQINLNGLAIASPLPANYNTSQLPTPNGISGVNGKTGIVSSSTISQINVPYTVSPLISPIPPGYIEFTYELGKGLFLPIYKNYPVYRYKLYLMSKSGHEFSANFNTGIPFSTFAGTPQQTAVWITPDGSKYYNALPAIPYLLNWKVAVQYYDSSAILQEETIVDYYRTPNSSNIAYKVLPDVSSLILNLSNPQYYRDVNDAEFNPDPFLVNYKNVPHFDYYFANAGIYAAEVNGNKLKTLIGPNTLTTPTTSLNPFIIKIA